MGNGESTHLRAENQALRAENVKLSEENAILNKNIGICMGALGVIFGMVLPLLRRNTQLATQHAIAMARLEKTGKVQLRLPKESSFKLGGYRVVEGEEAPPNGSSRRSFRRAGQSNCE
mmetsp:Transcript_138574/g.244832  ORF Transcript_138574/g.244832 Transcript_138574/m.244832 type:complete len:118 (-) Transcript_138574:1192-1545(-)